MLDISFKFILLLFILLFLQTFVNCIDPAHLSLLLEDERILVELIQLSEDYSADGTVLAHFYEDAKDFLYPQNALIPAYADSEREVLMQRSIWFSVSHKRLFLILLLFLIIKKTHYFHERPPKIQAKLIQMKCHQGHIATYSWDGAETWLFPSQSIRM